MSARRRLLAMGLLAVLGIALAAAITWGTSQLVRQRIGLSSEPLTAGQRLLPPSVAKAPIPSVTAPRQTTTQRTTTVTTTVPSAPAPVPTQTSPPVAAPPPTATATPAEPAPRPSGGGSDSTARSRDSAGRDD